MAVEINNEI